MRFTPFSFQMELEKQPIIVEVMISTGRAFNVVSEDTGQRLNLTELQAQMVFTAIQRKLKNEIH